MLKVDQLRSMAEVICYIGVALFLFFPLKVITNAMLIPRQTLLRATKVILCERRHAKVVQPRNLQYPWPMK
jgi:hypothetical protein